MSIQTSSAMGKKPNQPHFKEKMKKPCLIPKTRKQFNP